jgi:3'-5' exoribonuclease
MTALSDITPGPFEGVYAVREVERRLSRKGTPFLALSLADASGSARAMIFDQADFFAGRVSAGATVRIAGRAAERAGRLELVVSHVREAEGEVAVEELVPRSHRDPEELLGFVMHLADEVHDAGLRATLAALTGDQELVAAWKGAPCSRSGHHAYMGGLIEHTVGVASLAQTLCTWHPRLDSDLLLAAALVHDLGHARAFTLTPGFEMTDEGRLLGHVTIGLGVIDAVSRSVGLGDERRLELLHCVAWHHGPPPGQGPGGASPEAVTLQRVNSLEVGVKTRLEGPGPGDLPPA